MIRSILPSKNREAARKAKVQTTREHRRTVRAAVHREDPETTKHDFRRAAGQSWNVLWSRAGDKLNHFMRWCDAITQGMTKEEALGFVRAILPSSLIGDHAYGHWESHVRSRRGRGKRIRCCSAAPSPAPRERVAQRYGCCGTVTFVAALDEFPSASTAVIWIVYVRDELNAERSARSRTL